VDRYSSVEFGMIALQCPEHNHLHVIVPNVHLEVVDEKNNPVPIGEPGRVLITGLHTFAMPMIRYEQGDIVTLGKTCDTGITWPVIESVHGRVRSYIDGPDGERKLLTLFTADFLLMREIQDFRLVKFNDEAVFIAQTRDELTDEQNLRIVKSLQNDVFRGDQRIRILTQRQNLRPPKWKVREIYLLERNSDTNWQIEDIDKLLEESEIDETSSR
jgi:phenylacetate-CoA ligase